MTCSTNRSQVALGPEQPAAAAELPEVQVRLATRRRRSARWSGRGSCRVEVGHAGALRDINPLPGGVEDIRLS